MGGLRDSRRPRKWDATQKSEPKNWVLFPNSRRSRISKLGKNLKEAKRYNTMRRRKTAKSSAAAAKSPATSSPTSLPRRRTHPFVLHNPTDLIELKPCYLLGPVRKRFQLPENRLIRVRIDRTHLNNHPFVNFSKRKINSAHSNRPIPPLNLHSIDFNKV